MGEKEQKRKEGRKEGFRRAESKRWEALLSWLPTVVYRVKGGCK